MRHFVKVGQFWVDVYTQYERIVKYLKIRTTTQRIWDMSNPCDKDLMVISILLTIYLISIYFSRSIETFCNNPKPREKY